MTEIIIVGAGGHGSEVAAYLASLARPGAPVVGGFLDDARPLGAFAGSQVLGKISDAREILRRRPGARLITAVGSNSVRRALVARLADCGVGEEGYGSVVAPGAWLGPGVVVGTGTCVAWARSRRRTFRSAGIAS